MSEASIPLEDVSGVVDNDVPVVGRHFGFGLLVLGAVGLYAAFSLANDKFKLLEDPSFVPGCDINPILACGPVMTTPQASTFGLQNPFLGLMTFTVVITLGVVIASGAKVSRWLVAGLAAGSLGGLAMVGWLAFNSIYRIGALCPWCLTIWAVTIPIAVWSVLWAGRLFTDLSAFRALWNVRYLLVLVLYLVLAVQILIEFWDYWRTLL